MWTYESQNSWCLFSRLNCFSLFHPHNSVITFSIYLVAVQLLVVLNKNYIILIAFVSRCIMWLFLWYGLAFIKFKYSIEFWICIREIIHSYKRSIFGKLQYPTVVLNILMSAVFKRACDRSIIFACQVVIPLRKKKVIAGNFRSIFLSSS